MFFIFFASPKRKVVFGLRVSLHFTTICSSYDRISDHCNALFEVGELPFLFFSLKLAPLCLPYFSFESRARPCSLAYLLTFAPLCFSD